MKANRSSMHSGAARISRVIIAGAVLFGVAFVGATPTLAVDYRLEIVTGSFATRIGERVILTVSPPRTPAIESLLTDPSAVIAVQLSAPLLRRTAVADVVAGSTFDVESQVTLEAPAFRSVVLNDQPAFQINFPTSSANRPQSLRVAQDGVRAVRVTVTGADGLVAQLTTFLDFVSNRSYAPLPVFFVADVDGGPSVQPNGSVLLGDSERERLRDLRDLLFRKPPGIAIGIRVRPELFDALARSTEEEDVRLLEDLAAKLPDNDVLVGTFRRTSVASYASAGLKQQFEAQLLRGETVIDALNGPSLTTRGVWVTNEIINNESIEFLRGFGVTNVLAVGSAVSGFGADTDPSRPYALRSDSAGIVLGLADSRYARLLDEPTGTAHESAAALAAEIIAQRSEIASSAIGTTALASRQVVLASAKGTPDEPLIAATLLRLLRGSPRVAVRGMTDLAPTLEGLARLPAPDTPVIDVSAIQTRASEALRAVESVRDVVTTNEGLAERWVELIDVVNDTALDDTLRDEYLQTVLEQVASVREAVQLPTSSFTFGSRESDLRITLNNTSDFEVSLRLVLASPTGKMEFSPGSTDVVIPAGGQREIVTVATARSNGLIPVELVLSSPSGTVLDAAQVRIRVNAIAGLGRGVSAAFVVLLAVWWIVHARRNSRKKNAKEHPALRSKS